MVMQFTCLPNGLACGPRKYTKMMKPVFSTLRTSGHTITGYIDDTLLIASSPDNLRASVHATKDLLKTLGFALNYEKSVFEPSTSMTYLGFCINSKQMTVTLNEEKVKGIAEACEALIHIESDTIRNISKVIGMIVATFPAVDVGPLHYYRMMERQKTRTLRANYGNYDAEMKITEDMITEL